MAMTLNTTNIGGGGRNAKTFNHNRISQMAGKATFSDSYPTGGEALDLSPWFHDTDLFLIFEGNATYFFTYASGKVLAYVRATGLQVADKTDLHTVSVNFIAVGHAK